ncbi:hypothetical protein P9E76_21495 [Schinkia azotoformans]|uniref:Lipoprotein n=1 Tax=Schinkia azotoformans LMG 9581 TaxID=1131731 RepID=K6DE21_SCHAZ|nr:hypothetical protein [Schinkia azotoformans]EKN70787.1 hypothetical protein BAZO_00850 [Schinkia azotoformans LMG 9581]MEC1641098.1 hypothetical protein [Schinkia azotoformans]MEC1722369.1 hypothetical protein [Schinkia azotoformans]MEC1947569.1 hypothetical protein [Schinkia azotoformans]MED4354940.1 hypothetical protein [Schinkia azotoformans]
MWKIFVTTLFVVLAGCSYNVDDIKMNYNTEKNKLTFPGESFLHSERWVTEVPKEIEINFSKESPKIISNKKDIEEIVIEINKAIDLEKKIFNEKANNLKYIGLIKGFTFDIKIYLSKDKGTVYFISNKGIKQSVVNNITKYTSVPGPIPPGDESYLNKVKPIPPGTEPSLDDLLPLKPNNK